MKLEILLLLLLLINKSYSAQFKLKALLRGAIFHAINLSRKDFDHCKEF